MFYQTRLPPITSRLSTLCPYTTLCRSAAVGDVDVLHPRVGLGDLFPALGQQLIGAEHRGVLRHGALHLGTDFRGRRTAAGIAEMVEAARSEEHTSELQSLLRI